MDSAQQICYPSSSKSAVRLLAWYTPLDTQTSATTRAVTLETCYTIKLKSITHINSSHGVELMIILALTPQSIHLA